MLPKRHSSASTDDRGLGAAIVSRRVQRDKNTPESLSLNDQLIFETDLDGSYKMDPAESDKPRAVNVSGSNLRTIPDPALNSQSQMEDQGQLLLETLMATHTSLNVTSELEVHPPFASGRLANVHSGYCRNKKVFVKILRNHETWIVDSHTESSKKSHITTEIPKWAALKHQNICEFFGYSTKFNAYPSLVYAWCGGGTALEYLTDHCLWVTQRLRLAQDVAEGLQYLHENDVVHGDLTPTSVLVDDSGVAQLCDYGLAQLDEWKKPLNPTTGSPYFHGGQYRAPELLISASDRPPVVTFESDIYSLGCIILKFVEQINPPAQRGDNTGVLLSADRTGFFWNQLEACWEESSKRPKIHKVVGNLENLAEDFTRTGSEQLESPPPYSDRTATLVDKIIANYGPQGLIPMQSPVPVYFSFARSVELLESRRVVPRTYNPIHRGSLVETLNSVETMSSVEEICSVRTICSVETKQSWDKWDTAPEHKQESSTAIDASPETTVLHGHPVASLRTKEPAMPLHLGGQGGGDGPTADEGSPQMIVRLASTPDDQTITALGKRDRPDMDAPVYEWNDVAPRGVAEGLTPNLATLVATRPLLDLTDMVSISNWQDAAQGGFADVFCGYIGVSKVAVKRFRLPKGHKDTFLQGTNERHIKRVMQVWAVLKHRNISEFLGYATGFNAYPALISVWYWRGTAMEHLEHEALLPHQRLRLAQDVSEGLRYLHQLEIIHGDLKPLNVLVDDDGVARLCDFGLARFSQGMTATTPYTGTLRYKAPELFQSNDNGCPIPTFEGDIYSLGSTMLEFIEGIAPFREFRDPYTLHVAIRAGASPALRSEATGTLLGLTEEFWDLLETCWGDAPIRPKIAKIVEVLQDFARRMSP